MQAAAATQNARSYGEPMAERFGAFLDGILRSRGISHRLFARQIGSSQGFISQIIRNERRPPIDRIDAWISVLDLSSEQADQFRWLAHLEHATDWLRQEIDRRLS